MQQFSTARALRVAMRSFKTSIQCMCGIATHSRLLCFQCNAAGRMATGVKERLLCPSLKTRVQMCSWGLKQTYIGNIFFISYSAAARPLDPAIKHADYVKRLCNKWHALSVMTRSCSQNESKAKFNSFCSLFKWTNK